MDFNQIGLADGSENNQKVETSLQGRNASSDRSLFQLGAADSLGTWSNSVGVKSPWSLASLGDHLPIASTTPATPPSSGDVHAPKTPSTLWHVGWNSKPSDLMPAEETRVAIQAIYALHRPSV
jgi:hypothetical protein